MRLELLYNPLLLLERLGQWASSTRRLRKLRGTIASNLKIGHIDSLELLELLRPLQPKVIYDIGANIGTWTLLAQSIFPDAEVHAVEPLNEPAEEYLQATKKLNNISLHRVALGSRKDVGEMHVASLLDASSLLPMTPLSKKLFNLDEVGTQTVEIQRLDELRFNFNLPVPDIIKLDIQGYEIEALRGAEKTLTSVSAIITEVCFAELYEGQGSFLELASYLAHSGFIIFAVASSFEVGKPLCFSDILFVKKNLVSRLTSLA